MLTYLATLCLGAFIGIYALSAFAPVSVARDYYRRSWYLGGLFLAVAYLQKTNTPATLIKSAGPNTLTLITLLALSIAASFIIGWRLARREAEGLAQGA
jgi:hypothetical protein